MHPGARLPGLRRQRCSWDSEPEDLRPGDATPGEGGRARKPGGGRSSTRGKTTERHPRRMVGPHLAPPRGVASRQRSRRQPWGRTDTRARPGGRGRFAVHPSATCPCPSGTPRPYRSPRRWPRPPTPLQARTPTPIPPEPRSGRARRARAAPPGRGSGVSYSQIYPPGQFRATAETMTSALANACLPRMAGFVRRGKRGPCFCTTVRK